jgi:DNA polymerase
VSSHTRIIDAIGLGPVWVARDGQFEGYPVAHWLTDAPDTEAVPAPPVSPPAPPPSVPTEAQPRAAEIPAPAQNAFVATPPPETEQLSWEALDSAVSSCQRCRLSQTRCNAVFGRGNPNARWLLIGEAPGEQEDRLGLPFVGRAGKLLDNMLAAAHLSGEHDVYIANVLKCRPPGNRNPAGDEISACQDFLRQQIRHIQPEIIVALGRFAAQTLLETDQSIARMRGTVHQYQGIPLIVTFHPAYLLRNPPDKGKAWEDWMLAQRTLEK